MELDRVGGPTEGVGTYGTVRGCALCSLGVGRDAWGADIGKLTAIANAFAIGLKM